MLRDGRKVQTFWANKGIPDDQGKRESSDDVGAKPPVLIARQPSENGKNPGKRFELLR
jgi:hypothetical protein